MTLGRENEDGTARARVRTALGEFVILASRHGVRSVTPIRPGWKTDVPGVSSAAIDVADLDGGPAPGRAPVGASVGPALRHARAAADALRRHAAGERRGHRGSLDVTGSDLQRAVWERLRAIPFGATATYGEIATALGMPGEARTIGAAVAANPVCILVPCHRVVAADGSLRGFAWGLDLKRRLLAHEVSGALSLFPARR
jgi:O-6-methylguanine DNA methyltransferase